MHYDYPTSGTCARRISFDIDERGIVTNVSFQSGCDGNLKAIAQLVEGLPAGEIIQKCSGITCEKNPTSCGDQFARALMEAQKEL